MSKTTRFDSFTPTQFEDSVQSTLHGLRSGREYQCEWRLHAELSPAGSVVTAENGKIVPDTLIFDNASDTVVLEIRDEMAGDFELTTDGAAEAYALDMSLAGVLGGHRQGQELLARASDILADEFNLDECFVLLDLFEFATRFFRE